ncbi:fructose-specific PTS transporter subunit EIIC [Nocardia concava]|uniref:fructose-specific PTS transporter subunit EIIC n=1 Tax=Nocardia concava TaxID=257281 RepID=UPI000684F1BB|nr:fructose-specific PTS transporter subunit EIIC [Nocardia concava]
MGGAVEAESEVNGESRHRKLVAVTACPAGIAHTYMAAEKLGQAAAALGVEMKVETQGSIGVENAITRADVAAADGVIIAADKDVDLGRFAGKRVLIVPVSEGIRHPEKLIEDVRSAPIHEGTAEDSGPGDSERSVALKALMNGVSYMIPFVAVGGLLIAISLSLGGHTDPSGGLVIPKDSIWYSVNQIGSIGFTLMVPILSGYIAYAIGDRPALVPGMIGGWIANTGSLYDSKAGAGFLGAIVTGFLAGYLVLGIKKVKVPKFAQPIMPIIVVPIVSTLAVGLFFIYAIGRPISYIFEHLTSWLGGMTGTSAIALGAIVGLMIAFDMGGPVNKTAFLFGAGLIATGNLSVMGMAAAAIPVMPLGQGLATLLRRPLYDEQEREAGLASMFMGFFGISEGAIPFAASRPAQVIPANMIGGAVAGAIAGLAGVGDAVPHGGPIVALLGAIKGIPMFFVAVVAGTVVTAVLTIVLIEFRARRKAPSQHETAAAVTEAGAGTETASGTTEPEILDGALTERTVKPVLEATDKPSAIREMVALLARSGKVTDEAELLAAALRREAEGVTGLGDEIAIPHAKTDAVTAPVVAFARAPQGIDWDSPDGNVAKLIFMIAVPPAAAGDEHLRILALLARKLMDPAFRERLLGAPDRPAILEILGEIQQPADHI